MQKLKSFIAYRYLEGEDRSRRRRCICEYGVNNMCWEIQATHTVFSQSFPLHTHPILHSTLLDLCPNNMITRYPIRSFPL